ncbi:helix-turn-helix transcriptional regulator [Nostoc sp. CHAB 5836]|uniref:helix-turn-helix domain-containing protein n=1 Tax=Nostoc sp. CHAB 5836 TaxID=2780404 RepID=UPI001E5B51BC|nr:helix-turn-helix transcriptional regulator [Nostoc sp. CHAB 5836]MCC5619530.1 helix-turn-helix transcriptional regulator [Nostoc sp. CHAB 5836]
MSLSTVVGNKEIPIMAVDINDVAYVRWNSEKIATVKNAMQQHNNMSVRDLAQALQTRNISCSHQNLSKLLTGKYSIISLEIARGISESLSIPVKELVKIYAFSVYNS